MPADKYTDDEVRAIIDHALSKEHGRDLDHDQLLAVASEVGISRDNMEAAVRDVQESREVEEAKLQIRERRRRWFMSHLWAYASVNVFLFLINFLTTPGEWWVLFPLLGWGLGLLFHARAALSKHISDASIRREQKRASAERKRLPSDRSTKGHVVPVGDGPRTRESQSADREAPPVAPRVRVEREDLAPLEPPEDANGVARRNNIP